jgi:hypothetical protein
MTCEDCKEYQKKGWHKIQCAGIDFVDKCQGTPNSTEKKKDYVPKLSKENLEVFKLFMERIFPWVPNGMGGFQASAITEFFNNHKIDEDIRPHLFNRFTIIIKAIREAESVNREKDGST